MLALLSEGELAAFVAEKIQLHPCFAYEKHSFLDEFIDLLPSCIATMYHLNHKIEFFEYTTHTEQMICPCGSDKLYKNCCAHESQVLH